MTICTESEFKKFIISYPDMLVKSFDKGFTNFFDSSNNLVAYYWGPKGYRTYCIRRLV